MRVVVALGGNAIQPPGARGTIAEQRASIREVCEALARMSADGHELIITHGNGPQVGRMLLQDEAMPEQLPRYPLDVHVAETQGQLGYLIQQELSGCLRWLDAGRAVVSLVTQVIVDPADPAFDRPTKPVGPWLSAKGAAEYRARGVPVAEAPGGGWRRVVASPAPRAIVEADALRALIASGAVPIVAGGGGIPVVAEGSGYRGAPAVIDKDLTAAVIVREVSADVLLILTDVERVERGFGTPRAQPIEKLTAAEARAGVESGEFPRGSMGEKMLAAADAAEHGARAVITSLARARDALDGSAGTQVTR